MLLIECVCGCKFTLSEPSNLPLVVNCPNCGDRLSMEGKSYLGADLPKNIKSIHKIPDNAKITVTFDL